MLFLIDDRGRLVSPLHRLQAAFGTRLPPTVFADFLARNLGWISLRINKGAGELRLHPAKVNDVALLAAADRVRDVAARHYRLSWYREGWRSEEFATANAAVSRVMQLVGCGRADGRAGDFL